MRSTLLPLQAFAQTPLLSAIRQSLNSEQILEDAIAIQQIPAPTFAEDRRAALVAERFTRCGLHDLAMDAVHNVYGRWPGRLPDRPALLISAHTDTVFAADADLALRHQGDRVYGPGLGDNSLGVAALLKLADILTAFDVRPDADIWLLANSREEGLGDLGGIRAAWEKLGGRLGAAIVVEGMSLGRIYHAGIAVRRLHITCCAPGGHSWQHFGQPSAVHGLIELGARILAISPPKQPRTTYNIGLIAGGQSINSLASSAEFYLDLRSEDPDSLAALESQVEQALDALTQPDLRFTVALVGNRPAGRIPTSHPLVQLAASALETINLTPAFETGSTDANWLLASGLPAVTIGITRGGNAHRADEFIEPAPIADGMWQLVLLALAAAERLHVWQGDAR